MDDQIEDAMAIGRENERLISLGKAWCTHIRTDRSELGVGLVEEMTGLPITGGRFTCDFARRPGGITGMRLDVSAPEFYEDNCRGCTYRAPGGRVPNLSTWAEPLLAKRAEQERAEAVAQRAALTERQQRADHRTFIAASLPASGQEIVRLINRIDLEPSDSDAHESIRELAHLAPDAFADEIKEMLYASARMLRSSVLLDVLLVVDTAGDEELHELCLDAVRENWGRTEGCRYLGEHGLLTDLDEDLLDAVVFHAAPRDWPMFPNRGEPAAVLHYHSLDPDVVEQRVQTLLRHGEASRRAAAAAASSALVGADPSCGLRLLTALLDGLRHPENMYDIPRASGEIASSVALILRHAPQVVDAAVERRWSLASSEYRSRLMRCYAAVAHPPSEQLSVEVSRIVIARAVTVLSAPLERGHHGIEDDHQGRTADLLEMVVRVSPVDVVTPEVLIGLLLEWLDRERALTETEPTENGPTDFLTALEEMGAQGRIGRILREIANAIVLLGRRDPSAFIVTCSELYAGTESTPSARAEVVRLAGRVAAKSFTVNDALPLVYSAMLGDDQVVRAAGMEAAERVMRAMPTESIPPLLAEAVVTGLTDEYLIVGMAAVKAVHEVPADLIDHRGARAKLLIAAASYASDRLPRLTGLYRSSDRSRSFVPEPEQADDPAAAILIRHRGEPVMRPTVVQPGALHQFEVEARVTEWPEGAETLEITFLSVHQRDFLYASEVQFTRDAMRQPLEIRVAGERPPGDPPLALTAQAAFTGDGELSCARLAGNTTLEIVTFDPGTAAPLDMPITGLQLQHMMGELSNALPNLDAAVLRDARLLLEAVARFAHTVLDDRLGQHEDIDEAWFQRELRGFLQADPQIGARLHERESRAGGFTDLGVGDVVLELKVEKESAISLAVAKARYASQPTQYASAGDCQVSLLAVLDVSPKRAPAGVMGNEMGWAYPETTSGQDPPFPSLVGVIVVRTGFPRPSDFSH